MIRLLCINLIFALVISTRAMAATYPTYKGVEQLTGGECRISILQQYDFYLEILLTVLDTQGSLIQLETLTLETLIRPGTSTRDYDKTIRIDIVTTPQSTEKFSRQNNLRFNDKERTAMAFRQWQLIETFAPDKPKSSQKIFNYICPSMTKL